MALSEFEKKRFEKLVGAFVEKHRPPPEIRDQLDLAFRIRGQSVELFEIRPTWRNPLEKLEQPVAKATFVKRTQVWKVYWQRADMKWHRYEPNSEVESLEEFLEIVEHDEYGCFFG